MLAQVSVHFQKERKVHRDMKGFGSSFCGAATPNLGSWWRHGLPGSLCMVLFALAQSQSRSGQVTHGRGQRCGSILLPFALMMRASRDLSTRLLCLANRPVRMCVSVFQPVIHGAEGGDVSDVHDGDHLDADDDDDDDGVFRDYIRCSRSLSRTQHGYASAAPQGHILLGPKASLFLIFRIVPVLKKPCAASTPTKRERDWPRQIFTFL